MRVSKQETAANRARILEAAGRLFRQRGFDGVGVDALSEAAGLSHGSIYSRFGSKEALAEQALATLMAERLAVFDNLPAEGAIEAYIARYLSTSHRDHPERGCPLPSLGGDVARQGNGLRAAFTKGLRDSLARLTALMPGKAAAREEQAMATLATLVGALTLARAVDDPALSERILAAAGRQARQGMAA